MIIRKGEPQTTVESDGPDHTLESRRISDAGGLTQFGTYIHTLQPGACSSSRHWHECEDEMLYMLAGEATVVENDGEHILGPGDAACWPAGVANAHQVLNRSDAPCSYLICGTRGPRDVTRYPDIGRILTVEGTDWRLEEADGTRVDGGYWNEQERRCSSCDALLERSDPSEVCPACHS